MLVVTCQRLKVSVLVVMMVPTCTLVIGMNMFYNFTLQFTEFKGKTEALMMSTYVFKPRCIGASVLHWVCAHVTYNIVLLPFQPMLRTSFIPESWNVEVIGNCCNRLQSMYSSKENVVNSHFQASIRLGRSVSANVVLVCCHNRKFYKLIQS